MFKIPTVSGLSLQTDRHFLSIMNDAMQSRMMMEVELSLPILKPYQFHFFRSILNVFSLKTTGHLQNYATTAAH